MNSSRKSKNQKRKTSAGNAKAKKFRKSTELVERLLTIAISLFLSIAFCIPAKSGCPIPDVRVPDSWNEAWLERIKRSIYLRDETWKDNVVACSIDVNRDGEVVAQKVTLSSGSDAIDQDALDLICSVAPFPCAKGGIFDHALITIGPTSKVTIYPKFGKRSGGFPSRESYLEDWFKKTGEKIARGGSPDSDKAISLKFKLTNDNKIANLKVLKSSGSKTVDDQALRLLIASNPLNSAPSELPYKAGLIATFVKCPSSHVLFRISKEDESKIVNKESLREVAYRITQTALKMYDQERNESITAVDIATSMNKGVGGKTFGPILACRNINRDYQAEKSFVCSIVPTPYNDPKINSKVIQSTGNTLVDETLLEVVTKTPFNWKMLQAFPWIRKGKNLYKRSLIVKFNKQPAVGLEVCLGDEVFVMSAVSTNRISSVSKNESVVKVKHGDPLYPEPKKHPPTAKKPKQFCKEYENKWALVIGVKSFKHEVRTLKYCETDSKAFRDLLVNDANFASDHVNLLNGRNASHQAILDAVTRLKKTSTNKDLVVVYFRTHGVYASYARTAYFAASDTSSADLDKTAFKMDDFVVLLFKSIKAADLVIVLDSDFSGGVVPNYRYWDYKGRCFVLTSTFSTGYSNESEVVKGSEFTQSFIESLRKNNLMLSKSFDKSKGGNAYQAPADVNLSAPTSNPREISH